MTFTTMHDTADDGAIINSTVQLVNIDDLDIARWRVETRVDYSPMYHSHHRTRGAAEAKCRKMHKCYMGMTRSRRPMKCQ